MPPTADEPANDIPRLDYNGLMGRCLGKTKLAQKLLETFLAQSQADIDTIDDSLKQSEWSQVNDLAHRIKGASANVGAERVRANAALLERLSVDTIDIAAASGAFANLKESFADLTASNPIAHIPQQTSGS